MPPAAHTAQLEDDVQDRPNLRKTRKFQWLGVCPRTDTMGGETTRYRLTNQPVRIHESTPCP